MQKGKSLVELAQEITRISQEKKDYIAPTTKMFMNGGRLHINDAGDFEIGNVAHQQLADRLQIPKKYYDRMRTEEPSLLDTNVNTWFSKKPERRMVRTLDNTARAFLSDRYLPMDNDMVANGALPVLMENGNIQIKSSQITEKKLYIQAVTPAIQGEVKRGEPIQAGVVISNSEVGCGRLLVENLLYFLACSNGMIGSMSLGKNHIGRRITQDEFDLNEYFTSETVMADNHAFMLKIRDTVKGALDRTIFDREIQKLQLAAENRIPAGVISNTVEEVTKMFSLTISEGENVLSRLIEGGDLTQYGLAGAITNLANDIDDYDRVIDLERLGGTVVNLNRSEWNTITQVAA